FVREKREQPEPKPRVEAAGIAPERIVIVGGGAAGFAAAEMLRRVRYQGSIVMLSNDDASPVDRPNLSKDYLAGNAPEDWVPLRPDSFYSENGIDLRLETNVAAIDIRARAVTLADASTVPYDRLLLATGADPVRLTIPGAELPHVHTLRSLADSRAMIALAQASGLAIDRGLTVDAYLETSAPGIFAAGDIARWPDPHSGEAIRVEHWVVAERQGQVAARNMLGHREKFTAVPFFWSQHYDLAINYVGHAEKWDAIEIDGSLEARDCTVLYKKGGRTLATLTISRDLQSLQAEAAMEAAIQPHKQDVA